MSAALTSTDVLDMLRRHYQPDGRPPAGVFAAEIGAPDGRRRADLIWAPTTLAGGTGLIGHEVKVSRADVLTELANPVKAESWSRYCTRWWLVVSDPALVEGLPIPEAWGVMAPPSGRRTRSMTILRDAPKLDPEDPAPGYARLVSWQLYGTHERIGSLQRSLEFAEQQNDTLREQVSLARANGSVPRSPYAERAARIVRAVESALDRSRFYVDEDAIEQAVVAAAVDHVATAKAAEAVRREVQNLIASVKRITEPFGYSLKDLQAAEKAAATAIETTKERAAA